MMSMSQPQSEKTVLLDSPRALAVNVLVGLGIMLSVGVLVERWLRVGHWGQFGLRGLLVVLLLLALIFFAGGGWYFSEQIRSDALRVDEPSEPEYPHEVVAGPRAGPPPERR